MPHLQAHACDLGAAVVRLFCKISENDCTTANEAYSKGRDTHSEFVLAIGNWRPATSDFNRQLVVCDTLSDFSFKTSYWGTRNCQFYL